MPATLIELQPQPADTSIKAAEAAEKLEHGELNIDMSGLPQEVITLFAKMLRGVASGNAITVIQPEADMSTSEVADYLNVSRTYVIKLMLGGKLPYYEVGVHKRVTFQDAKFYKDKTRQRSREALQDLVDQAQELGMGY